jgi:hypothetical protein
VKTAGEALLRELDRVIKRKRSLPEESDLERLLRDADQVITQNQQVILELSKGYPI